jgi:Bacterial transcriptional activator domain
VAADDVLLCRTCGKPRGENIAEGTRCAACGHRQAIVLCLAVAVSTGYWAFNSTLDASAALMAVAVALVATPPALVTAVLAHELAHAGAALVLGQRLTRVLVGEGTSLIRFGRDPQLVLGSVLLGNGLTTVLDLRAAGYRSRICVMLLFAPLMSATLAMACYVTTTGWPAPARTAALLFAGANAMMAVLTSIPVTTFGGRVWSDLASAIYVARANANQIEEHMLLSAQDRMAILVTAGLHERAIETARAAVAVSPTSGLARCLLAYALHHAGRQDEARAVARHALAEGADDETRRYLARFLEG